MTRPKRAGGLAAASDANRLKRPIGIRRRLTNCNPSLPAPGRNRHEPNRPTWSGPWQIVVGPIGEVLGRSDPLFVWKIGRRSTRCPDGNVRAGSRFRIFTTENTKDHGTPRSSSCWNMVPLRKGSSDSPLGPSHRCSGLTGISLCRVRGPGTEPCRHRLRNSGYLAGHL